MTSSGPVGDWMADRNCVSVYLMFGFRLGVPGCLPDVKIHILVQKNGDRTLRVLKSGI
jgi:hypothetical protein